MTYFSLNLFDISRLHSLSMSLFKLSHISKNFPNIFIQKNLHINGPAQFKPIFFKGQLYMPGVEYSTDIKTDEHEQYGIKLVFCFFFLINFWLRWVFVAVCGLPLVAASGGYSSSPCAGFSLWWLLLLRSTGSRRMGFRSCGTPAQ